MRKVIKRVVTIILTICLLANSMPTVWAAMTSSDEIMPLYNNALNAYSTISISDSGLLKINYNYTGISGTTTKVVITTYIEKKFLGFFWTRVDNGKTDNEWVDTLYEPTYRDSRQFQLESKGTYRVSVTYKIYGNGGSADEIPYTLTESY